VETGSALRGPYVCGLPNLLINGIIKGRGVMSMKIAAMPCYNLDLICFLNALTGDEFYLRYHQEDFDKFYPGLSDEAKAGIKEVVAKRETTMLSSRITLLLSSLKDFTTRDLCEMLKDHVGMRQGIHKSEYKFDDEELDREFAMYSDIIVPLVKELEQLGLKEYWQQHKLPDIQARCDVLNEYFSKYNIYDIVTNFKDFKDEDIAKYVCAFARPLGTKLCGYHMISDYKWNDKTILTTVAHEIFHPPYDYAIVDGAVKKLAEKPWVIEAFENQNESCRYSPIEGFIEENVVEALGIYVMTKLGIDMEPQKYFEEHDYGSHVISPIFYDYLFSNPKNPGESFEDYFIGFVDGLS
jgi:hypothetical protein